MFAYSNYTVGVNHAYHSDLRCAVVASVVLTQWRTKLRRQMNERDIVSSFVCSVGW